MKLKELLSSPPVLAYPCFSKPFVLHTDASGQGLGAVLEQEQADGRLHTIAYASQTLSTAESRYGIADLEALVVVWAAKHFRAYLHCIHRPHSTTCNAESQAPLRMISLMGWCDFRAGARHLVSYHLHADALSRVPVEK